MTTDGINYDSITKCITVHPSPIVDMIPSQTTGCSPLSVCFTDASTSTGGNIVSRFWDFCDGLVSGLQNPCHVFQQINQHNCFCVHLEVTDANGCAASKSFADIICVSSGPLADFTTSFNNSCSRDSIVFHDHSSPPPGDSIVMWQWDFGDGNSTMYTNFVSSITHAYPSPGQYNATLLVRSAQGCQHTIVKNINVTSGQLNACFNTNQNVFETGLPLFQFVLFP